MRTFTTFKLAGQLFGIEILHVREINKQLDITAVQQAPEFIRGLINLRGQIVTVMDLRGKLTGRQADITHDSCNIILRTEAELAPIRIQENRPDLHSVPDSVGLLVDDIDEIVNVEEEAINPPPSNIGDVEGHFLTGVIQLEGRLLGILSVAKLLEHDKVLATV